MFARLWGSTKVRSGVFVVGAGVILFAPDYIAFKVAVFVLAGCQIRVWRQRRRDRRSHFANPSY